jgi:hypothetical protein
MFLLPSDINTSIHGQVERKVHSIAVDQGGTGAGGRTLNDQVERCAALMLANQRCRVPRINSNAVFGVRAPLKSAYDCKETPVHGALGTAAIRETPQNSLHFDDGDLQ